jgi:hypothetical protein
MIQVTVSRTHRERANPPTEKTRHSAQRDSKRPTCTHLRRMQRARLTLVSHAQEADDGLDGGQKQKYVDGEDEPENTTFGREQNIQAPSTSANELSPGNEERIPASNTASKRRHRKAEQAHHQHQTLRHNNKSKAYLSRTVT